MKARALIFSPVTMGYGSPQFLHLYDTLRTSGFEPVLFEREEPARPFQPLAGYERRQLRGTRFGHWLDWIQITRLLLFGNVELVVLGWDRVLPLPWLVVRRARVVRYCLEVDDDFDWESGTYPEDTPTLRTAPRPAGGFRGLLRDHVTYDAVIAPEENRLQLARQTHPDAQRGFLILNAPPRTAFASPRTLDRTKPVVLYQGQMSRYTLASELLELIERTSDRFDYVLAGPCDEDDRRELERLERAGHLRYHGWVRRTELEALQHEAHIGLVLWRQVNLATRFASPNKLLEYVAWGLPVVCTPNESLVHFNAQYDIGVVAPDFTAAALMAGIDEAVSSPERYATQSIHNIELHRDELNWEHQVAAFTDYLAEGEGA